MTPLYDINVEFVTRDCLNGAGRGLFSFAVPQLHGVVAHGRALRCGHAPRAAAMRAPPPRGRTPQRSSLSSTCRDPLHALEVCGIGSAHVALHLAAPARSLKSRKGTPPCPARHRIVAAC